MSTFTIGQVAERTGFTASSLRFYEGVGILTPTDRTAAGYRLYDDHSIERLAFVARAKQLGCSLDEIVELVDLWAGDRCEPVQRRVHELVTARIADAERKIAELTALVGELHHVAATLERPPVDGPCDDSCACITTPQPTLGATRRRTSQDTT